MTTVDAKPKVLYDDAFPKLPNVPSTKKRSGLNGNSSLNILTNKQNVREVLEIPNIERRSTDENLGRAINDIAKLYQVEIDISSSKNKALTIFLTGPKDKVAEAKRLVVKEFQVQSSLKVSVNPEYYRFVIGKKGALLRELEKETCTKINIPTSIQSSDQSINISGPKEGCEMASRRILKIVDEQSKLGSERLLVPKIYHPFVRGPRQSNIQRWKEKFNVKIDMPPPSVPADDIFVSGDKNGVELVVKEIKKIHHEASTNTKTIQAKVKRPQHKFVFGPGGSGIADILEKTGSSVEMPTDETSEVIIIRGPPSNVGRALSMVYEKAESSVCEEIKASNRFHKILIGKKGSNLAEFLSGYQERVKVEFIDNSDKIEIEGPLEDVQEVKKRLVEKIKSLEATMAMVKVKIDTKYKGFIVGRDGANIRRLRDNYNVNVNIIDDSMTNKSEVVIEGDAKGIQKAGEEIKELVQKLENEKIKDLIIEPKHQKLLKTPQNGVVPIRVIYDEYPSITIIWSDGTTGLKKNFSVQDQTSSIVKIQGQKQHVDAASEKIMKILKNLKENNFHLEFRLYQEFRQFVFGQNTSEVKKILQETECRIVNPPADEITLSGLTDVDSQIIWIVGKQSNVQIAFDKIEAIQKKQANIKEVRVKLPAIFARMAGDNSSKLRSIREECDNVNIRLIGNNNNKSDHCEMIISGPSEALAKAENLIKELSSKTNEECEEAVVKCDRKYHGYLIGRAGQKISQFRNKHTVQLYFPDKLETDPVIANEIRLVGNKAKIPAAKKDLEDQIKAFETEVELTVQVPTKYSKLINQCKKTDPIISQVRVTTPPKEGNVAYSAISLDATTEKSEPTSDEMITFKIVGPKNLAEAAKEEILTIVKDMQAAISIQYNLEDRNQIRAFFRLKGQFREWEVSNKVTLQIHTESAENDEETGTITLTGKKENIEMVYEQKIKPSLPITEKVELPHEFHYQLLINPNKESTDRNSAKKPAPKKTETPQFMNKVSELQQTFNINIRIPPAIQTDANYLTVRGTPKQIESAKLELAKWQAVWEEEKQLRIAKSFEMTYEIPERLVLPILEKRDHYNKQFDVWIRENTGKKSDDKEVETKENKATAEANGHVSSSSSSSEEEESDEENVVEDSENNGEEKALSEGAKEDEKMIPDDAPHRLISTKTTELVLKGIEASCLKLKEELDATVEAMKDYVCECLNIPQSVHSQLIGARRNGVLKMQEEFKVFIEFPLRTCKGDSAHIVVVFGPSENVDQCCDNLIYLANELLEKKREREEKYQYKQLPQGESSNSNTNKKKNNQKDLIIVDAPWSKLA